MASGGRTRAAAGGGASEAAKRRKVAFSADGPPVSCNANECLKLHIVLTGQELQEDAGDEEYTCDPEFAEKIFGEDGKIYGYKDLKIDIWLHAATLHAYAQIQYTSKSAGGKKSPSTDVLAKLREAFGDGLTEDRDSFQRGLLAYSKDFQKMLEKHGDVVYSWRQEANFSSSAKAETAPADRNCEMPDKLTEEATNADVDSEMPDKLTEETTNADIDSELRDKENATADIDSKMLDKESATAGSDIDLLHKVSEETTNADSNSEIPDEPEEESANGDNNTEIPVKLTEENTNADSKLKRIVRVELADPDVRDWHARSIPLSLLYVEGATTIDCGDPLWEVYLAVEGEGLQMRVAGFCNVYRFYHYPDSTRLRISQILVLPPYQGDGFGLHLLEAVNTAATARCCYDVTMEEPSEVLQKLRDTMDVLRLLALPSVDEAVKDAVGKLQAKKELALHRDGSEGAGAQSGALVNFNGSSVDTPSQSSQPGSKEKNLLVPPASLMEEVRKSLKVSKMQFKRCWEQLLFMYLDPADRDLQDVFQEAVVQRLNSEIFEKEGGNKGVGKQVVDTDNEYDNSKTFIMMRSRKIDSADGNGCAADLGVPSDEVAALVPGPEEKGKVLQEELKQREDDMVGVAQTVARHCRTLGLNFPSMKVWEQVAPGTNEPATL